MVKQAILIVGHGSRDQEGNEELLEFVQQIQPRLTERYPIVETCFLEFANPDIPAGIDRCVEQGATQVTLIPLILFAAGHSKLHIPHAIDDAKEKYPHVQIDYGKPIGVHPKTIEILQLRAESVGLQVTSLSLEDRASMTASDVGERTEEAILLVGRGSSDPDANSDLAKIARLLWEHTPVRWVETCYIGVTQPDFPEGIRRCVALGAKKITVLPYFLFTGILIKRMERMLQDLSAEYADVPMVMAEYFGLHEELAAIIQERVDEAVAGNARLNCDFCQYRIAAAHEHHHHHDHEHDHHHDHDHAPVGSGKGSDRK